MESKVTSAKRMITKVTFAEFSRSPPVVFETDSEQFFLSIVGDEIQLLPKLLPTQGRPDLVLQVDCVFSKEEEGRQLLHWHLRLHRNSPQGLFKITLNDGWVGHDIERFYKPGQKVATVRDGDVVGFSSYLEVFIYMHRMMLSAEEEKLEEEVQAQAPQPTNFNRFPNEVLVKISSFLPFHTVLNTACFISKRMFNAAKAVKDWQVMNMTEGIKCLADMNAVCGAASGTCKKVKEGMCHHIDVSWSGYSILPLEPFLYRPWPCLEKLTIFNRKGFKRDALNRALSSGNRVNLRELEMIPRYFEDFPSPRKVYTWEIPQLTKLAIGLDSLSFKIEEEQVDDCLFHFPQLKTLTIEVLGDVMDVVHPSKTPITNSFALGYMENLEELRLVGNSLEFSTDIDTPVQETYSWKNSLKRLSLDYSPHNLPTESPIGLLKQDPNGPGSTFEVEAGMLFNDRHSELRTLNLARRFRLTGWEKVSTRSLENLRELSITASCPVPFSKMPNLEAARIRLLDDASADEGVIPGLLTHQKQRILVLDGQNVLHRLAKNIHGPSCVKNLTLKGSKMNFESFSELNDLSVVLESVPNLVMFQFDSTEIRAPEIVGNMLNRVARGLVSVKVAKFPELDPTYPFGTAFIDSVTRLSRVLVGNWEITDEEYVEGRWRVVHVHLPEERQLDQADLRRFECDSFLMQWPHEIDNYLFLELSRINTFPGSFCWSGTG